MDQNQFQGINSNSADSAKSANGANGATSDQPTEPEVKPLEVPTDETLTQARQVVAHAGAVNQPPIGAAPFSATSPQVSSVSPPITPPPGDIPVEMLNVNPPVDGQISKSPTDGVDIPIAGVANPTIPDVPFVAPSIAPPPSPITAPDNSIDQTPVDVDTTTQNIPQTPLAGLESTVDSSSTNQSGLIQDEQSSIPGKQDEDLSGKDLIEKDIFELMGVKDMSQDKKQELYQQMQETIQKRAFAKIHDRIPEVDIPKWKKLIDGAKPQELTNFLRDHHIDLEQILTEETMIYKAEMAELAQPIRKAQQKSQSQNQNKIKDTQI